MIETPNAVDNAAERRSPAVLALTGALIQRLAASGVRYCHWKSNQRLEEALRGETDLDLLVDRADAARFERVLQELGFRIALGPSWESHPGVFHFFSLDSGTGRLVHLHVYYHLVTGGGLLKNYHLPLEHLLLEQVTPHRSGMPVPDVPVEFLVFVLRKACEHASLAELLFLFRERAVVREEIGWLEREDSVASAVALLRRWLPYADEESFRHFAGQLRGRPSSASYRTARKLRRSLRDYRLRTPAAAAFISGWRLVRLLQQRWLHRRRGLTPGSGGLVIPVVGSDGAGKSTLVSSLASWLGAHFDVRVVHTGAPPSTVVSVLPKLMLPLLRRLYPHDRMTTLARGVQRASRAGPSFVAVLRSALVAYDQRVAILRAFRAARNGAIVICDRFPSGVRGGMDGSRVDPSAIDPRHALRASLARWENRCYGTLPRPDLVFFLEVSVEVALQRNAQRSFEDGHDDADDLKQRYEITQRWQLPGANVKRLDAARPSHEILLTAQQKLWESI